MKRLLAALLGGVLAFRALSPVSAAGTPDEWWTPITSPQGDGWRSLYLSDNSTLNREPSALYAQTAWNNGTPTATFHCMTVDSPKCIELNQITAGAFLQPCSAQITTNCIESLYATDSTGARIVGNSPVEYPATATYNFQANDAINLPAGGSPSIWNIADVIHGGGNSSYMVQAYLNSALMKPENTKVTTEQFVVSNMTVNIVPVKIINGRYVRQIAQDSTEASPGITRGVRHDSQDEWRFCAMIDNGSCAQRQAFPAGYTFGVKLRLKKKLSGWLHGRIYNPDVVITTSATQEQIIEVSASPVRVPVVGEWFRWEQLTPQIQQYILDGKVRGGQGFHDTKALARGNFQEIIQTSGKEALETLGLWLPQIKDKASASQSTWTFYTLPDWELANTSSCVKDAQDLVGFVTTNAAVYAAGPPAFNTETQSLDYKVMAPHYTAQGEVFKGTYDLKIRASVARCIYGFSSAPIQASISIVSEDGSTQVATQTVNETDGWLNLSANGFTYSAPTISVKMSQAPAADVAIEPTTPSPSPSQSPLTNDVCTNDAPCFKVKVTCKKGSTVKTLIGQWRNPPRCPKGYKRVSLKKL